MLFGVTMPLVTALVFPTYVHKMPFVWQERARLLELPFVASELLVIGIATARGMTLQAMWRRLSADVRVAVLILLGAMTASTLLMATQPADAALQSIIQVVHLHFALGVWFLASRQPVQEWDTLIDWLVAGCFVLAGYSAWRLGFPPTVSQVPGGLIEWSFALPGFISVRYLGTWLGCIAAALSINLLYRTQHDRLKLDHLIFVFVLGFMFWTGTRAAILGVLTAIALCAMTFRRLPDFRSLAVGGVLALLALMLAISFAFDDPLFSLVNAGDASSVTSITSGRTELWGATIARWMQSPVIGWGTGSIFFDVYFDWTHTQPHNAFLQFAVSWGILGLGAGCWLIGRAVIHAAENARHDQRRWPVLALVYSLLAMSMVDGALYYPRFIIMIVAGLALLIGASRSSGPPRPEHGPAHAS